MNVNDMIQSIARSGVMKPHQYAVTISMPAAMIPALEDYSSKDVSQQIAPRIERVTLPPTVLSTFDYPSASLETTPIVKNRETYEAISVGIILSEDGREKKYFDNWIDMIHGRNTGYHTRFYDDYVGYMTISILSAVKEESSSSVFPKPADMARVATYDFYRVYPINVGDVELSYGDNDTYSTIAVTFNWDGVLRVN